MAQTDKPTVLDAANYLIGLAAKDERALDPMKLQKLLYYAQMWHLAEHNETLFGDPIRAWTHGPVVVEVWKAYSGNLPIVKSDVYVDALSEIQIDTLVSVWMAYGHLSGPELSRKTHEETPWKTARGNLPDNARGNTEISRDLLIEEARGQIRSINTRLAHG